MTRTRIAVIGIVAAAALLVAGLAGATTSSRATSKPTKSGQNLAVSGTVSFDGVWTSTSGQPQLEDVIKAFNKKYPNVKINYNPVGDNIPTVLPTVVAGGHPPDIADVAQPGLIKQFVQQHKLKPLTFAASTIAKNFSPAWRKIDTYNGKLYALLFKAANKSLYWYNVPAFKTAGITAPHTWAKLLSAAKTLKASGTPAYSIGGAQGWTLTDLFENIYLRLYGAAKYNLLSQHKIKWTDPSVIKALKTMAQVVGDSSNIAGGTSGALQYNFNDSVTNAFGTPPKAAIVFEADFVAQVILQFTKAKAGSGFNAAVFPTIGSGSGGKAIEIAGDSIIAFRDTPAVRAFINFLATPEAAAAWAKSGGFGTGNHNMSASVYPDAITRATEAPLPKAKAIVFDMSDAQPASFGSTAGQGEWGLFQDFIRNPKDVTGLAKKLETQAAAAYKKGK